MKKFVLLFAILSIKNFVVAQVGIGTNTPNPNAALDVQSANKGLLIPRVDLVALTSNSLSTFGVSGTPTISLLVYNTTASTLPSTIFQTGYYYWDGSNWIKLNTGATSSAATGWSVTGNSGINPTTNFIGTTDNQPIRFRVNNGTAGQIGLNNNTSLGANSHILFGGSENTGLGAFALALTTGNDNVGVGFSSLYSNVTGANNTAVGSNALNHNISGYSNVALGKSALYKGAFSSNNVAIGDSALFSNADSLEPHPVYGLPLNGKNTAVGSKALYLNKEGRENTAIGFESMRLAHAYSGTSIGAYSLYNDRGQNNVAMGSSGLYGNTFGSRNTALGSGSLVTNTTGSYNTGVGFQSDVSSVTLDNATAVGAQARVDCSNCLVLGSKSGVNGATSDVNVGIGKTSPSARLDVSGLTRLSSAKLVQGSLFGNFTAGGALLLANNNDSSFMKLDGSKIQAEQPSGGVFSTGSTFSNLHINPYGGAVGVGLNNQIPNARLHIAKPPTGTLGGNIPSAVQINGTQYNTLFNYGGLEEIFLNSGKNGSNVNINDASNGNIVLAGGGGNVGISNIAPTAKLDIITAGSLIKPHIRMYEFNDGYARLEFKNSTGNNYWHIAGYNNLTNANERLNFYNNTTGDVMSITGDGKVGIGTSNPTDKLMVNTVTNSTGISHTDGNIKFSTYLASSGAPEVGAELGTVSNHPLHFYTNNSWAQMTLLQNGNFGIGITNPGEKLAVNGRIRSKEVLVQAANWPDFVFDEKYTLPTLAEIEQYIHANKHLPNIPAANEVETNGQNLGEIQKKMLQKVEELTLYIIEQNKRIEKLEAKLLAETKN
jgi:trimeric autotransporter adhesin